MVDSAGGDSVGSGEGRMEGSENGSRADLHARHERLHEEEVWHLQHLSSVLQW